MKISYLPLCLASSTLFTPFVVEAVPITATPGIADTNALETFDSIAQGSYPEVIPLLANAGLSGVFEPNSAAAGTLGPNGPYEAYNVSATAPRNPLALFGQGPNENIVIVDIGSGNNVIVGELGAELAIGASSFMFADDQDTIGISVLGVDPVAPGVTAGTLWAQFFGRDGGLIDTVALVAHSATNPLIDGPWTFASSGPKFAGVTFTNNDNIGLGYDDLRYNVPEPTTPLLLLIGIAGLAGSLPRAGHRHPAGNPKV